MCLSKLNRGLVLIAFQTKLLGQMLYYVLTTGSGQQTLGEEYCDITQVISFYPSLLMHFTSSLNFGNYIFYIVIVICK